MSMHPKRSDLPTDPMQFAMYILSRHLPNLLRRRGQLAQSPLPGPLPGQPGPPGPVAPTPYGDDVRAIPVDDRFYGNDAWPTPVDDTQVLPADDIWRKMPQPGGPPPVETQEMEMPGWGPPAYPPDVYIRGRR